MKILVAGCGKIGITVISSLLKEGHEVTAIDSNPAVVKNIADQYDIKAISGSATDADTLLEAGVKKVELFTALTSSDELNMLSCFIAKHLGAHHTVARIRNPEYNYNDQSLGFLKRELDLSMTVNPDRLIAEELNRVIQVPSAVNTEVFLRNSFEMIELNIKTGSPLDGAKVMDLRHKYSSRFLICCVQRGKDVFIPDGSFILQSGDLIGLTAPKDEISKLLSLIGMSSKHVKNVMIIGGSRSAIYLARLLEKSNILTKIIETDYDKCEKLNKQLSKASIINGNGIDEDILREEGILTADAFISLTGVDETNILLSYAASKAEVPKVITKINRTDFIPLAKQLGIESIVSPKKVISDIFVRYARALENSLESQLETLYKLMDDKIEAAEFIIDSNFKFTNIPIKELKLKKDLLLVGIQRNKQKAFIPDGDDTLLPEDRVVIISSDSISNLSEIIER